MKKDRLIIVALMSALLISGCDKPKEDGQIARPVKAIEISDHMDDDAVVITGQISAHTYAAASFRISGKIAKRFVSVGDTVRKGQVLAQLEDTIENENLVAARAELTAAEAVLAQAEPLEKRAAVLIRSKAVSQSDYDDALRRLKAARAQVSGAEAKVKIAKDQMDYTSLVAEQDGVVLDKLAEESEVVAAGQPVLRIAYGDLRDALFDVSDETVRAGFDKQQKILTCLDSDRSVCAEAMLYEVSPESDPQTRTYQVKAQFEKIPPRMLLGQTVVGQFARQNQQKALSVPASALSTFEGKPAVWLYNKDSQTVTARSVEIGRYTTDTVTLTNGVHAGDWVVTAGVQALHNGQSVKVMEAVHEAR